MAEQEKKVIIVTTTPLFDSWVRERFINPQSEAEFKNFYMGTWEADPIHPGASPHIIESENHGRAYCGGPGACRECDREHLREGVRGGFERIANQLGRDSVVLLGCRGGSKTFRELGRKMFQAACKAVAQDRHAEDRWENEGGR